MITPGGGTAMTDQHGAEELTHLKQADWWQVNGDE
jgi:hypothetical protein